jgi:hypothetical protein
MYNIVKKGSSSRIKTNIVVVIAIYIYNIHYIYTMAIKALFLCIDSMLLLSCCDHFIS